MVLKGYTCSLDWPKPEHRPSGDIDIWLFGKQKEADALLSKEKGIKIDSSHHHHTIFSWRGFMVENHYDFINSHHHKANSELEKTLKDLSQDDSHITELYGQEVFIPSPNFNALFLVTHMVSHFTSSVVTLRQVLDWAFFVKYHGKDVDWNWLLEKLKHFKMLEFFNRINAICVEDLGFDTRQFPYVQFEPVLKDRIFTSILYDSADLPKNIFKRVISKYRRWKKNGWKRHLCYDESTTESLLMSIWLHIVKPSSI